MKVGVLGTGAVGKTIAARFAELGHSVLVGTRDPAATLASDKKDMLGNPPFKAWLEAQQGVELATFARAAAHGEIVVNATSGGGAIEALRAAGEKNLAGKIVLDISNPLDFSRGMPPRLTVCNDDSLGEQIQRAFPEAKVVKTLNTVNCLVMARPKELANGGHTIFVSGNDAGAKKTVTDVLRSFGWEEIVDLGDITTARGTEMFLPLWVRLYGALGTPSFSFKLVR